MTEAENREAQIAAMQNLIRKLVDDADTKLLFTPQEKLYFAESFHTYIMDRDIAPPAPHETGARESFYNSLVGLTAAQIRSLQLSDRNRDGFVTREEYERGNAYGNGHKVEFEKKEQASPDAPLGTPFAPDGVINIDEAAKRQVALLREMFPDLIKVTDAHKSAAEILAQLAQDIELAKALQR